MPREAPGRARRILIIFNPAAGRRAAARLRRTVAALGRLGCTAIVRATAAPGDAERLARAAEPGFERIVAAGGDGTINEVVNGLAAAPRPLALLPFGTANVLARELGLPRRAKALAALIAEGTPRPIWPGRVGDRLFLTSAGIGFDAEVVARLDARLKRRFGKLAFVWAILDCLWRRRRRTYAVHLDGRTLAAATVIVAKTHFYAGRFVLAPAARAGDPLLYVVLFHRGGPWAALRYLAAIGLHRLHRLPDVTIVPARTLRVDGGKRDPVQADGDIAGRVPVCIGIAPAPVPVIAPRSPGGRALSRRRRAD